LLLILCFDIFRLLNAGVAEYNLVMLSDVHLGTIIGKKHFQKAVTTINQLQPDAVVIVGDLVDEDLKSVITDGMGDLLRQIKTRRGILAVPGNHEYIGGVVQAEKYISRHGVRVLHDKIVNLPGDIQLVGCDDRTNARRKTLPELMQSLDNNNPILVLDHQPFHLAAVAAAGVDVQLSGHTHHGQLWSLNYLTQALFEISWGYKKIQNTHFYVSSGWEPGVHRSHLGPIQKLFNFS
ncbi:metallophosphoesterase, partial [bacterium]|nr:metallophosphoesterase [bacterium]